jgi:hypothetical protein
MREQATSWSTRIDLGLGLNRMFWLWLRNSAFGLKQPQPIGKAERQNKLSLRRSTLSSPN